MMAREFYKPSTPLKLIVTAGLLLSLGTWETVALGQSGYPKELNGSQDPGPDDLGGVSAANLMALWHLNNSTGTTTGTTADSSGHSHTAALNNFSIPNGFVSPGKLGQALSFDGMDDYLSVTSSDSTNGGWTALTLEIWIRLGTIDSNYHNILDKRRSDNSVTAYLLQLKPATGGYQVKFGSSPGASNVISSTLLSDPTRWYHMVVTYDGTAARIYINGIQEGSYLKYSVAGGPIALVTDNPLKIGARGHDNLVNLHGQLDEVAIYNTALTPEQVLNHYQRGLSSQ